MGCKVYPGRSVYVSDLYSGLKVETRERGRDRERVGREQEGEMGWDLGGDETEIAWR